MNPLCFALVVALLMHGRVDSATWDRTSSPVQYGCTGHNVTIWWSYLLSAGEQVADIKWYFSGSSDELIAVWADGEFLALPAFHNRVEQYDNAGLILNNVLLADYGNYSVMISIHDASDDFSTLRQSVTVQIGDTLMTQDGHLHVSQKAEAVLDTATDQWAIQLQCGTFTYLAEPPFQVEWTTPSSEQVVVSSNYSDNHFNLLLPGPVTGGSYTCRIPTPEAGKACLQPNETDKAQASLGVNKVLARLLLLESENKELKEKLQQLTCPTASTNSSSQTTLSAVSTRASSSSPTLNSTQQPNTQTSLSASSASRPRTTPTFPPTSFSTVSSTQSTTP